MTRSIRPTLLAALLLLPHPPGAPAQQAHLSATRVALAAAAAPDSAAPEPASPPAPDEKKAAVMEVGTGRVKFSGLVQAWYVGGSGDVASTFRVRRAEMKFSGEVTPAAHWTVTVDPSKALKVSNSYTEIGETRVVRDGTVNQGSLLLQDAYVTLGLAGLEVDAGQFKLPLSLEGGAQSSAKLETIERALFIADGKYGLVRDLGVMVSGPVTSAAEFQAGLFNGVGESQNTVDANDAKVAAGRLVLRTPLSGLQVGASGAWSGAEDEDNPRRDRLGAEILLARGPLTLRSEVMRGWDAAVERLGWYALAGYTRGRVQGVARFDVWDPDTRGEAAASDVTERDYTAGASYFVAGSNVKVQANYVRRTFGGGVLDARSLFLVNVQTAW